MRAALLMSALVLAGACSAGAQSGDGSAGAGPRTGRTFQVGAFDRISLSGSPDVAVAVGGRISVRAEGEAADLERLDIAVVDGELRIGLRPGAVAWSGARRGITVHVTVPALQGASLNGSGGIDIDRVEGQSFAAGVRGSGDIDVRSLRVGEASFALTGSGDIRAAGAARRANASLSGSGDLSLAGFEAADATVSLAGSGDIALRATGTAQVQLAGSGRVAISGTARCTIARVGSGEVRCPGGG